MDQIIMNDICTVLQTYILIAVSSGIIWMIIFYILYTGFIKLIKVNIKSLDIKKVILLYALYIYFFIVISIALLSREPGSRTHVSLNLFATFSRDIDGNVYAVENVLLFLPLGIALPLLSTKFNKAKFCLGVGLICSLLIEISQFITKRGYFQTDDILLNFIGSWIGFVIINNVMKCFQNH